MKMNGMQNNKLITLLLWNLIATERTVAFTSSKSRAFAVGRAKSHYMSVVGDNEVMQSAFPNGIPLSEEANKTPAKEKAIAALEKLLARQKLESMETERLLRKLNTTDIDGLDPEEFSSSFSVAASIASGFDYGFVSRSEGSSFTNLKGGDPNFHGPPANVFQLGVQQFSRNLNAIKGEYRDEEPVTLTTKQIEMRQKLNALTINCTAIWERELADGPIEAPWLLKIPYLILCFMLDTVFEGRYAPARFFLLETVARMPYFAYITMLHFYETLGFWRRSADIKRIHFAEEINEFRHLLIMESLGGDQRWWVRFMAQHSAIAYYIALCILWTISPTMSYKFSELLETHAVNTYGQFVDENEELLKELPPSLAAVEYYSFGISDPFYSEFQTNAIAKGEEARRPGENLKSLYDVFCAIREDEGDHVKTMTACMDPTVAVQSPSLERRVLTGAALTAAAAYVLGAGDFSNLVDEASTVDAASVEQGLEAGSGLIDTLSSQTADFVQKVFSDEFFGLFGVVDAESTLFEKLFNIDPAAIEAGGQPIAQLLEEVFKIFTSFL